jgi:hypothetical protein
MGDVVQVVECLFSKCKERERETDREREREKERSL